MKSAAVAALAASGVSRDDIVAVICSSQYSSIVPVDRHGQPTSNMVLWQDHRGTKKDLKGVPGFPKHADNPAQLLRWLQVHGLPPIADGLSLAHLRHLKFSRPDVYARTAWLLEPMDYVTMRLTGRATANQASAFMYLMTDNRRLDITDYHPGLVDASLIDREKLPDLVPMDAIVGTLLPEVADELGLSPSTKVVTGLNDTQAGGIGAGAFTGTHAAVSVGSTSVMITHVDFKRTDVFDGILSMPSPVPDTYFVMAENGMAGAALERFLTNIVYGSDHFSDAVVHDRYEALQRVAGAVPAGSDGLMFLPWLGGSMAPSEDGQMRGGFLNISTTHDPRGHGSRGPRGGVPEPALGPRPGGEVRQAEVHPLLALRRRGAFGPVVPDHGRRAGRPGPPVGQLRLHRLGRRRAAGLRAPGRPGLRRHQRARANPPRVRPGSAQHRHLRRAPRAVREGLQGDQADLPRAQREQGELMDHDDIAAVLDVGIAAVRAAGPIALEYFRTDMAVDNKLAGITYDPVTEADKRVEAHVRAAINARFPDHQVIGEEGGTTGSGPISWIIDPIDGTRAFISGMPTWGTLLGLVVDGEPVAGVMHQPFTDETFAADPARGSRFLHAGTERILRTRATATLEDAVLYSTHPTMLEWAGVLDRYRALSSRVRLQRWGGDCYAFALVAMGTIDLAIDGCLMPYDIVPLIPIIELAGGVVTDIEGRVPMAGGTVIAAANPDLHAEALAALRD